MALTVPLNGSSARQRWPGTGPITTAQAGGKLAADRASWPHRHARTCGCHVHCCGSATSLADAVAKRLEPDQNVTSAPANPRRYEHLKSGDTIHDDFRSSARVAPSATAATRSRVAVMANAPHA